MHPKFFNYTFLRFRTVKKSLKIKDATLDDTGIYMCKGTNGFGSQDARIDLIVIGKIHTYFKQTKIINM